jgi:small subunit ribosomal protein S7
MSRRRTIKKNTTAPDPVYNSRLIHMIVNRLMKNGKKALAYKMLYDSLKDINEKTELDPLKIVEQAIQNATPSLEVKARRVGGSTFQVPLEVDPERGKALAIRWILLSCRNKTGKSMVSKLTNELIDASNKTGNAVRKRDEVLKMAEANKAFSKKKF